MNSFLSIFKYNFGKQIRSMAYKIVTGIMVVLIIGSFLVSKFINQEPKKIHILAVDETEYFSEIEEWNSVLENSKIELSDVAMSAEECKEKVLNEEGLAVVHFTKENNGMVKLNIYDNNILSGIDLQIIERNANTVFEYYYGKEIGIMDTQLEKICRGVACEVTQVDTSFEEVYLVAYCLLIFLVLAIMMYGSQVAGEITYAKTNRVMELLLTSASPYSIFMGITLSIGLAGLLQMGIILGVGVIAFNIIKPEVLILDGLQIDFSVLSTDKVFVYLLFFVLSYLLYAVLNAGIGSLISKNEDIMVAILPTTLLSCVQMFTGLFAIASPKAVVAKIFSYIPFTSAGTMVMTYLTGNASVIEVIISLLILLVSLILLTFYSIRLFVNGVIYYGNFSFKKILVSGRKENG